MVIVVVGALVVPAGPQSLATAQDQSPEELWNAYPLNPGEKGGEAADPAPTPTAGATPAPSASTTPARDAGTPAAPAADSGGGGRFLLPLLLCLAVVALAAGQRFHRRVRREEPPEPPPVRVVPAIVLPPSVVAAPSPPPKEAPRAAPPRRPKPAPSRSAAPPPRPKPAPPRSAAPPPRPKPAPPRSAAPPPGPEPVRPREQPRRPRRFARKPWPPEAATAWTCVIDFKPGYLKSRFRAMAAPPGESRRTPFAQSRSRFTFMDEPGPEDVETAEIVDALVAALTEDGWMPIGPSGNWYGHRFLWDGEGQPRPLGPQTGKEANA